MKKRILHIAFLVFAALTATGQVQTGVVKTKGYPDKKGIRLAGVTVKIKNANPAPSDQQGKFSVKINGKTFMIEKVVANGGYQVSDKDIYRNIFTYPVNNFTILLETPAEKLEHRDKYTEQILASRDKEIKRLKAENKRLRDEGKISEEKYQETQQELIKFQTKDLTSIIDEYMKIDWDVISDFNRELNTLILNGEIMRADSLLRTQGDVTQLDKEVEGLIHFKEHINKTINESIKDKAERYYNWHRVYLESFRIDSAAYCLERRAALDTTNCEWLNDAGLFAEDYLANYNKALQYFETSLRNAQRQNNLYWISVCYNNIGNLYNSNGDYKKALGYYNKALEICLQTFGESHPNLMTYYNNIGNVYSSWDKYDKALEYYNKALQISPIDESHPDVATSYTGIGMVYHAYNEYDKALVYLNKALKIFQQTLGKNHSNVAACYNNIGFVYCSMHDYDKALEHYNKALEISIQKGDGNHPEVATSYNNIGYIYCIKGDYDKALEYYNKALEICLQTFGESHPNVATSYNNIGGIYNRNNNYDKALEYYNKALEIRMHVYDEPHTDVADCYNNIGAIYEDQGDYDKALEHYNKALEIYQRVYDEFSPDVAIYYNSIGGIYYKKSDYNKALEYSNKALEIYQRVYDETHPDVAGSYFNIGDVYKECGDHAKALEYYEKALNIFSKLLPDNHTIIENLKESIKEIRNKL